MRRRIHLLRTPGAPARALTLALTCALLAATFAALAECSPAAASEPADVEQRFTLKAGESAPARDAGLQVGFEGVASDSRCAKGTQCVWAGDAVVRVWVRRGSGAREFRELHAGPGDAQAATVLDHELRLLKLEPYPVSGRLPALADYVATLALRRSPQVTPER